MSGKLTRMLTGKQVMLATALVAVVITPSCGDDSGYTGPAPTFAGEIAELIYTSCTPCHRPGGPTPFSLQDYDDVAKRIDNIVEVTSQRIMPPWLPSHGDFVGDRRLTAEQIAMLARWRDDGAPRGDAESEPACPEFADGWQLREPDHIITVREAIVVPASGPDIVRNFVMPAGVNSQHFVEAVEIQPGNPAVHHAVLAIDTTSASRMRDGRDPQPGFSGMDLGTAVAPDGHFIGWTPGKRPRKCKPGMSWRLQPGSDFVLQLHLTPTGKEQRLQPRIGLFFTDEPPSVVTYPLGMFATRIDLPPGAKDVIVRDSLALPVAVSVQSIYPHAHYLCSKMQAWAKLPGGERRELFAIDRWDFDWQDDYTYQQPINLPPGTKIAFAYHYDNSADNPSNPASPPRHVVLGNESTDEMANLTLQVTTADASVRMQLAEASIHRDLTKLGYNAAKYLELASLLRDQRRFDEALAAVRKVRKRQPKRPDALREEGHCLAGIGKVPEAEAAYRECLQLDDSDNVTRMQLAGILLRTQRAPQAIKLYEQALQWSPQRAALHNNLATAYLVVGTLDKAEKHYRKTIAIDPQFGLAWFNLGRILTVNGQTDEARKVLTRALQLRPQDPRVQQALQQIDK